MSDPRASRVPDDLHDPVLAVTPGEPAGIGPDILPVAALEQLLHHSEDLNLVSVCSA